MDKSGLIREISLSLKFLHFGYKWLEVIQKLLSLWLKIEFIIM